MVIAAVTVVAVGVAVADTGSTDFTKESWARTEER